MTKLHKLMIFSALLVILVLLLLPDAKRVETASRVIVEETISRPDNIYAGIPILMYHHLVEDLSGYEGNEMVISVDQFREQMRFLAQEGFMTLNARQILDYLNGKAVPENTVVITFDDGYESKYTYAYPILKEYGLTAIIHIIVAVTPGEIGGERRGIPKISWDQMDRMVGSGVIDIQSHAFDSHYYAKVNAEGYTKPKLAAKLWIENEKRNNVKPGDDPLKLNRINVSPRWTLEDFKKVVKSE